MQYGFIIDQRRCIGCHACTVACKSENDVPVGDFRTWVKYTEVGTFPSVRRHFGVLRCNQCTHAPCITICPVVALDKRKDGIVDLDRDACIGCKACMQACPYDALYLNDDTGSAEKCHFCAHRVERGLKPACEVVCPEEAIISGDLHDPGSRVSTMLREVEGGMTRRPEQSTGPNVWYLGAHDLSLRPGIAEEPETWLWSDRRYPPPPRSEDGLPLAPDARDVLDVDHKIHWGWKVSLYLVTKGIGAGAALWAPFVGALGATGFSRDYLPEVLALLFTTVTTALLVADLKRPAKFLTLLFRPNTKSWLVRGAWVLMAFSGLTTLLLVLRLAGVSGLADLLRWPNLLLGAGSAGYTAYLFAQCEGRDLWQDTRPLLVHLLVQAVLLGGVFLLPLIAGQTTALVLLAMAVVHHGFAIYKRSGRHPTENSRQAAALLTAVPAWPGSQASAFHLGLALSTSAALLIAVLAIGGFHGPFPLSILALLLALGVFLYEQAFVRAGQWPPLS